MPSKPTLPAHREQRLGLRARHLGSLPLPCSSDGREDEVGVVGFNADVVLLIRAVWEVSFHNPASNALFLSD